MAKGNKKNTHNSGNSSDREAKQAATHTRFTEDEQNNPQRTVPRTNQSFQTGDGNPDDKKDDNQSETSSRPSGEDDEVSESWSSAANSKADNQDLNSLSSNGRRRRRKKHIKKGEGTFTPQVQQPGLSHEDLIIDLHQNMVLMVDKLNDLTSKVTDHDQILSRKKEAPSDERNDVFSQLARATEEKDWRDVIRPELLHMSDLSADNNAVVSDSSDRDRNDRTSRVNDTDVNSNVENDKSPNQRLPKTSNTSPREPNTARRDSYTSRVYNDLDRSTKAAQQTQIVIMRQEKECKVKISQLELASVANAIHGILEFQEQEGTPVNMMKVLSPSVREYLRNKYRVAPEDFRAWSVTDLFKIMARETVVSTSIAFYDHLRSALINKKVMPWSSVTPLNHETFFLHQIRFIDEFKTILKLMLENNARNCPKVDTKPYGLLRLFRELNNPEYFDEVYNGKLKRAYYDNMYEFFDEYRKAISEHYQVSLLARDIPYASHKRNNYKPSREDEYHHTKRRITKQLDNKAPYSKSSSSQASKYPARGSNTRYQSTRELNHITSTHEDDDDEEQDVWRNAGPEGHGEDNQDEDSVSVASNETDSDEEDQKDNQADDFDQQLAAMENDYRKGSNSSSTGKSYACLKKILSGNCDRPNCPYDHRPEKLREAAKEVEAKASAFHKTPLNKPSHTSKPNLIVRDKGKFNNL